MRLKIKGPLLAAGALFAAGFIVWPGCATPPLPASRTPVSSLRRADFSFVKGANKSDIVSKLGAPDEYFADLRVACYKLNRISRRRLWLLFGVLPVGAPKDFANLEVAMIQFDDHDRMQRFAIKFVYVGDSPKALRYPAQKWITTPAGNSPAHWPDSIR